MYIGKIHPNTQANIDTIHYALQQIDSRGTSLEVANRLFDVNVGSNLSVYTDSVKRLIETSNRMLGAATPSAVKAKRPIFDGFVKEYEKSNKKLESILKRFLSLGEKILKAIPKKTTSSYKEQSAQIIREFREEFEKRKKLESEFMKAFDLNYYPPW
jgi:actin-like ATPase involved in cell morphogenesis